MGYAEKQIPPWAARPEIPSIAPPPELTAKQMAGQTADAGQTARLTAGAEQPETAEIHAPREGILRSPEPAGQPQP